MPQSQSIWIPLNPVAPTFIKTEQINKLFITSFAQSAFWRYVAVSLEINWKPSGWLIRVCWGGNFILQLSQIQTPRKWMQHLPKFRNKLTTLHAVMIQQALIWSKPTQKAGDLVSPEISLFLTLYFITNSLQFETYNNHSYLCAC